jgi:hypothetical protein
MAFWKENARLLHQASSRAVKRRYKPGIMVMEMLMTKEPEEKSNCERERCEREARCEQNAVLFFGFVFLF